MQNNQASSQTAPASSPRGSVAVLNRDLFFGVRIANTLRAHGYLVEIAPSVDRLAALLQAAEPTPLLAIIDMAAVTDWSTIDSLAHEPTRSTPLLAFGPHKDVASFRAAKDAGVDRVVSNGDFHRDMLALVERYARR